MQKYISKPRRRLRRRSDTRVQTYRNPTHNPPFEVHAPFQRSAVILTFWPLQIPRTLKQPYGNAMATNHNTPASKWPVWFRQTSLTFTICNYWSFRKKIHLLETSSTNNNWTLAKCPPNLLQCTSTLVHLRNVTVENEYCSFHDNIVKTFQFILHHKLATQMLTHN